MSPSPSRNHRRQRYILLGGVLTSLILVALSGWLLLSPTLSILVLWQATAALFIGLSLIPLAPATGSDLRWVSAYGWIPPLLAGLVGIQLAVSALNLQQAGGQDLSTAALLGQASLGVLLSWLLMHVSFADIYGLIDRRSARRAFHFPGEEEATTLDYVYLSISIGTSFAVSDVSAITRSGRMIVIIHSVISFCYNALVVAVAFQVLQSLA